MTDLAIPDGDRRSVPRKSARLQGLLIVGDCESVNFEAIDLANGGIRIELARELSLDERCEIRFPLIVGGVRREVTMMARVMHIASTGRSYVAGLQFVGVDDAIGVAVTQFMMQH